MHPKAFASPNPWKKLQRFNERLVSPLPEILFPITNIYFSRSIDLAVGKKIQMRQSNQSTGGEQIRILYVWSTLRNQPLRVWKRHYHIRDN